MFSKIFNLPDPAEVAEKLRSAELKRQLQSALKSKVSVRWRCNNCSYWNEPTDLTCAMCELDWTGRRSCPPDKWECLAANGGCTFFNSKNDFYCSVCNRSRTDVSSLRM
jgi:hypothetical protein